jgi:hypothetical protein
MKHLGNATATTATAVSVTPEPGTLNDFVVIVTDVDDVTTIHGPFRGVKAANEAAAILRRP